jgi:hypothetical protein
MVIHKFFFLRNFIRLNIVGHCQFIHLRFGNLSPMHYFVNILPLTVLLMIENVVKYTAPRIVLATSVGFNCGATSFRSSWCDIMKNQNQCMWEGMLLSNANEANDVGEESVSDNQGH